MPNASYAEPWDYRTHARRNGAGHHGSFGNERRKTWAGAGTAAPFGNEGRKT